MASLKCGNCKEGIHYHGEPNGIELRVFSSDVWKKVIESKYNPKAPKMHTEYLTPSPYFYTSETILHDFKGMYCDIWRCPNCGTLPVFDAAAIGSRRPMSRQKRRLKSTQTKVLRM